MNARMSLRKALTIASISVAPFLLSSLPVKAEPVEISSKGFTEDYLQFSECTLALFKLLGIDSEKFDFTAEQRHRISEANFGWLDENRLYEMQFKIGDFYSDAFIDSLLARFNAANDAITKTLRDNISSAPKEHLTYLARELSMRTSVMLGSVQSSDANRFHRIILSCDSHFMKLANKYQ